MSTKGNLANSYKTLAIETASPGKIVLMLFDGALRFMMAALDGFHYEKLAAQNEAIHNNIVKCLNILTELQSSLDLSLEDKFPLTMFELYEYMQRELTNANIHKKKEPIEQVYKMLKDIRDAWAEMLQNKETAIPSNN